MEKSLLPLLLIFICCSKSHPSGPNPTPPADSAQLCRITMFNNIDTSNGLEGNYYKVIFQYENETPVSIHFTEHIYLREDFEFRHDQQNRVTDVIRHYPNQPTGFNSWHRLKYDNQNRIIRDSLYYGGTIGPGPIQDPASNGWSVVFIFKYDDQYRMIQETQDGFAQGILIHREGFYYYNNKGNLDSVVTTSLTNNGIIKHIENTFNYDILTNIHRTNMIWQFLDRDYNKNNSLVNTTAPNQYGLPTNMAYTWYPDNPQFLGLPITKLEIEYACK